MNITIDEINEIAERAATLAIEKYKANEEPALFRSKSAVARHLKCDWKTVDSMINRGEVLKTRDGRYKINNTQKKF